MIPVRAAVRCISRFRVAGQPPSARLVETKVAGGEVAFGDSDETRRVGAVQIVAGVAQEGQLFQLLEFRRHGAAQAVVFQPQLAETRQFAQFRRNRAAQGVEGEHQALQSGQLPQFGRHRAGEPVAVQSQRHEFAQPSQRRRDAPVQTGTIESELRHALRRAADGDALPQLEGELLVPVELRFTGEDVPRRQQDITVGAQTWVVGGSGGAEGFRAGSTARSSGGRESRRLFCSRNSPRYGSFPSSGGIGPLSSLKESARRSRLVNFPNSGGTAPVSRLWLSSSDTSSRNRPSAGGMRPLRSAPASSSPVTRAPSEPPMVTPCHDSMGRCPLQLSRAPPARVSLVASRTSQSARNPGLSAEERRGSALPRRRPNAVREGANRSGGYRPAGVPRGLTASPVPVGSSRSGRWRPTRAFPGRSVSRARAGWRRSTCSRRAPGTASRRDAPTPQERAHPVPFWAAPAQ